MAPATRGATGPTQRFCFNCGAKVTKTQAFCKECGTDLRDKTAAETEEVVPPAEKTAPLPPPPRAPAPPPARSAAPLPPPAGAPSATAAASTDPGWPAYVGAGACGLLAIATGLSWFGGGFSIDAYDVPFALLFSDSATGGLPFGVILLLVAVAGLAAALIAPSGKALALTLLSAGGLAVLLMLWYVIRAISNTEGASLFDVLSWGAWLALISSMGIAVGGLFLQLRGPVRAGVSQPVG